MLNKCSDSDSIVLLTVSQKPDHFNRSDVTGYNDQR